MRLLKLPGAESPFRCQSSLLARVAAIISIMFMAMTLSLAQGTRGTISGKVTDSNSAVIKGATVKLIDVAKQKEVRTVQTNDEGFYQFVEVEPAIYDIAVSANGFAETKVRHAKVEPNRNLQLETTLNVGSTAAEVTVTGAQELVERESPTLGTTVDTRRVTGLPLDGRNVLNLALLQPGVSPVFQPVQGATAFGSGLGIRVNGSRGVENNITLDGSNNNEVAVGSSTGAQPRPDAVQEFRLLTSNFEAEFGRNTGSVINVVTKSGASDFHGNARFFYRPTFLSAARFFDQDNPSDRPLSGPGDFRRRFERKEFGGNFGGPIWLPKKVFGPLGTASRNRAFFFVDYEERRQLIGDTRTITNLPTPDERNGIFTARLTPGTGLPIPLLDPATGAPFPVISGSLTTPNSVVRQQIPSARFATNPIVQYYLGFLPSANTSGTASAGANEVTNNKYLTGRGDFLFTDKQTVNFTYNWFDSVVDTPFAFGGASVPGFGVNDKRTTYNMVARHTYALTSTLVNSLLLGYARNNQPATAPQNPATPTQIGFANSAFVAQPLFIGPPTIRLFDRGDLRLGNTVQGPQTRITENFQVQEALSWAKGDHRFKFGFDGTRYYGQQNFVFINNGGLLFSRNFGGNTSGDDFADFLLGNPVFFQFGNTGDRDFRQSAAALFAQDTWRVRDNFTVSLGLRWEYNSPLTDKFNRVAFYRAGATSQLLTSGQLRDFEGRVVPVTPGGRAPVGLVFVGDPDPALGGTVPAGGIVKDWNNFAPRLGLAYSVNSPTGVLGKLFGDRQTVIRAGFGMYYGAIIGDNALQQLGAPGFGSVVTQVFGNGAGTLANPFAPDPFPNFNGNGPALQNPLTAPRTIGAPLAAFSPFALDPNLRTPYVLQYHLTVERNFIKNYVLSLSYVGNRGRKLYAAEAINPGLGTFVPFPAGRTAPGGTVTNANINQRRLNNDIQGAVTQTVAAANSWYDAFEAQVQKRFSSGLLFQVAYTFSKSLNEADTQRSVLDFIDRRFNRGPSADDVPHRLVASWLYELPFSRNLTGVAKTLFDGFSIGGIATFQSGTTFSVGNTASTVGTDGIISFADLGAAFRQVDPRKNNSQAFNADAFKVVALPPPPSGLPGDLAGIFRRGTSGRNQVRAANGINNFDLILSKKTRLWSETTGLELRFEAFNAFNHTQFATLDTSLNSPTFGKFISARESRVLQLGARISF